MIASWMLYSSLISLLVVAAAALVEHALRLAGRPVRGVWAAAIVLTLVLPFVTALRTIQPLPTEGLITAADPALSLAAPGPLSAGLSALPTVPLLDTPLLVLWAGASLLLLAALLHGVGVLQGRRREWRRAEVDGREVLVAPDLGPAVIGWRRMQIVLPAWALTLDPEGRRLILAHEEEHIRRRDPAVLFGGLIAALLVPWNAPLWYLYRRLRLAIELDCDARVIASGADLARYGEVLLVAGARCRSGQLPALATFAERATQLESRITALTPGPVRRRGAKVLTAGLAATAALLAACTLENPLGLDLTDSANPIRMRLDGTLPDGDTKAAVWVMARNMVERRFPGALAAGRVPEESVILVILNADKQILDGTLHLTGESVGSPLGLGRIGADQIESIDVFKGRPMGVENLGIVVATVKPDAMLPRRRRAGPGTEEPVGPMFRKQPMPDGSLPRQPFPGSAGR